MFRVAPSATSEHKPGAARLIVNPHVLRCLLRPSLTEVPSLGRSYPASSVVRTSPPPQTARPGSRELPVDREQRSPLGLPVLRLIPCVCMLSPLPRQVRWRLNRSLLIPRPRPSPNFGWVGSCIMVFGACSAFTHVTACRLAKSPSDPLHRRLRRLCCLHRRSDCFYEKVIKVKADVAALLCLISVLVAFGTSGPPSLRLLVFLPFLFFVAFATFPQKIWR